MMNIFSVILSYLKSYPHLTESFHYSFLKLIQMKGNEELLHVLNSPLVDKLNFINQYMVQSEM
jgi:hypothetical protein